VDPKAVLDTAMNGFMVTAERQVKLISISICSVECYITGTLEL